MTRGGMERRGEERRAESNLVGGYYLSVNVIRQLANLDRIEDEKEWKHTLICTFVKIFRVERGRSTHPL